MEGATAEVAKTMLEKFRIPNVNQARVEIDNLPLTQIMYPTFQDLSSFI